MAAHGTCRPTAFELYERVEQHLQKPPNHMLLNQLRDLINVRYRPSLDHYRGNTQPSLQELVHLFGDVFFDGGLRDVRVGWGTAFLRSHRAFGCTRLASDGVLEILIDPDPRWHRAGMQHWILCGSSTTDFVMSTLLHESIHAFLRSEGCPPGRCERASCRAAWDEQVGDLGGHGGAFCRIAALVVYYARQHNLWNCQLDLKLTAQCHLDETERMLDDETAVLCWPDERVQRIDTERVFSDL